MSSTKVCLCCENGKKLNTLSPGKSVEIEGTNEEFCKDCVELLKFAKVTHSSYLGEICFYQSKLSKYSLPKCRQILFNVTPIKNF